MVGIHIFFSHLINLQIFGLGPLVKIYIFQYLLEETDKSNFFYKNLIFIKLQNTLF